MAETFFNTVILVGRAGNDTDIKYFDNGKAKASVNIAVDRYKSKAERETDWFRIEFWDRDAEIAGEYVKKGQLILIEGRYQLNSWTDNAGNQQTMPSIICQSLKLLGSKKENTTN